MDQEKKQKIADILKDYKWHNKPLEDTIKELVETIKSCSSSSRCSCSSPNFDSDGYASDLKLTIAGEGSSSYSVSGSGFCDVVNKNPDDEIVLTYNADTGVWECDENGIPYTDI